MKKIGIFCFIYWLTWNASFGQESKIIELDPVEIIPTDKLLVYSNFSKKHKGKNSNILGPSGSIKIATVSGFKNPENSTIELEGLEFFFNYNWSKDSSGFYVQPVVVGEDGLPIGGGADFPHRSAWIHFEVGCWTATGRRSEVCPWRKALLQLAGFRGHFRQYAGDRLAPRPVKR
jgi:hypothetical protein